MWEDGGHGVGAPAFPLTVQAGQSDKRPHTKH